MGRGERRERGRVEGKKEKEREGGRTNVRKRSNEKNKKERSEETQTDEYDDELFNHKKQACPPVLSDTGDLYLGGKSQLLMCLDGVVGVV